MHIIVRNKKSGTDPYRVKKEEFLHNLSKIHKGDRRKLDLDLGDMAAAHMLLSKNLEREGVSNMTVQERVELTGQMVDAVNGDTSIAQREAKIMLEKQKQGKIAQAAFNKKEMALRSMLERKKK